MVINDKTNSNYINPWLSVIIPIFNAEKYLIDCLESIKKQSFADYEILLIDDGSTDSSSYICQQFCVEDKRFKYFRKDNEGPFQARLYGAKKSSGTYFTFCDADDYYYSNNAFQLIYNKTIKGNYSVIQFCFYKKYNHLKRKLVLTDKELHYHYQDFILYEYPKLLCNKWDNSHLNTNVWNKVYHSDILKSIDSPDNHEKIFWGEDLILNLQLLSFSCNSICFIPDALYCYRQFSGDTNKFSLRTMEDLNKIKKYQLKYLEKIQTKNILSDESIMRIKNRLFSEVASWLYIYICQACEIMEKKKVIQLLNESLALDSFVLTRQFYLNHSEENWEAVRLLREADPDKYIEKAKEHIKHRSAKEKTKALMRKIYASI